MNANTMKRFLSMAMLLCMVGMYMLVSPVAATAESTNLFVNGTLADTDADGKPVGWSYRNAPSFVTPEGEGYAPPAGWDGNYVDVNCVTNTGIEQVVKTVEPGQLYRVSALYQTIKETATTSNPGIWEFVPYYFKNAESSGEAYAADYIPVALAPNNSVANPLSFSTPFTAGAGRCEYVFRMPALAENATLPEGASIGLLVRIRTTTTYYQVKIADLRLEKTENWVINGSFENGNYGWTPANIYPAAWINEDSPAKIEATDAKAGSKALKIIKAEKKSASATTGANTVGTDNNVSQKVYLDAGKTYRIRFWFNSEVNATSPRVGVRKSSTNAYYAHYSFGENVSANTATTLNAWRQYTYYFTVEAGTPYVEIRLSLWQVALGTVAWFDGVELTEVEREGEVGLYSITDGAVLTGLPTAGQEVQVRGIRKTKEGPEDVTMITCLYKRVNEKRVLDSMQISEITDLAQSVQHSGENKTTAEFVEAKDTFKMPNTLENGVSYEMKCFIWDSAAGLKPMADVFGLR